MLWTFIKNRKILNISSTKGRLLEFACLVFYPSPAPGLPLYPFLGPDQSEKREFSTTCMRMLGTTPFPRPQNCSRYLTQVTGHCFNNTGSILNIC